MPRTDSGPCHTSQAEPGVEPLWHLCYRFLWPFRCFRDVTRGTMLERQQNYRHNRSMRVVLPGFAAKWLLLTAICFGCGAVLDQRTDWTIVATGCYIAASVALIVAVKVAIAWIWLKRFPDLF